MVDGTEGLILKMRAWNLHGVNDCINRYYEQHYEDSKSYTRANQGGFQALYFVGESEDHDQQKNSKDGKEDCERHDLFSFGNLVMLMIAAIALKRLQRVSAWNPISQIRSTCIPNGASQIRPGVAAEHGETSREERETQVQAAGSAAQD